MRLNHSKSNSRKSSVKRFMTSLALQMRFLSFPVISVTISNDSSFPIAFRAVGGETPASVSTRRAVQYGNSNKPSLTGSNAEALLSDGPLEQYVGPLIHQPSGAPCRVFGLLFNANQKTESITIIGPMPREKTISSDIKLKPETQSLSSSNPTSQAVRATV